MSNYTIHSFVGVGNLKFGMSRTQVHNELGLPIRSRKDRSSSNITDFWIDNGLQLAFSSPEGQLREISLYSNISGVELANFKIFEPPSRETFGKLCELDGDPRVIVGIVVFLRLGITATGFLNEDGDDRSVTAFAPGVWQVNDPKLVPFKFAE
jgi:hypothetical protein